VAPLRFLFGIGEYPPEHGTYGSHATAVAHEYRLAVSSFDADEQYRSWLKAKTSMEFECDARIYRLMKTIGVFNELEEFEFERERSQGMVQVAKERRRQQRLGGVDDNPLSVAGHADEDNTMRDGGKRVWRREDPPLTSKASCSTEGYIQDVTLAASMEAQLEEEKQRRIAKIRAYEATRAPSPPQGQR
jgi:hypothetical protein